MRKPSETYTLHLFSLNGDGADNSQRTYTVEWSSFLPKQHKRFVVSAVFTTIAGNFHTHDGLLIRALIPCSTTLSTVPGRRRALYFGVADSQSKGGDRYFVLSNELSTQHTIEYPTENRFTVELADPSSPGGALLLSEPYNLFLMFRPVE